MLFSHMKQTGLSPLASYLSTQLFTEKKFNKAENFLLMPTTVLSYDSQSECQRDGIFLPSNTVYFNQSQNSTLNIVLQ